MARRTSMFERWLKRDAKLNGDCQRSEAHLIDLRQIVKTFQSAAGSFTALKGVDLQVDKGEFLAIIGKSGSGKSTLINMITGIDRPTSGEVLIGDTAVNRLSEGQMAEWRGRNLGVIFQFFQLLPSLSIIENVMLPMDFCNMWAPRERRERAMQLLAQVEMDTQANKLPNAVSGGQQQRVAIARALANDPPMLVADGEIVNQYVAQALSALSVDQLAWVTHQIEPRTYAPGASIVTQGEPADRFYI